MTAYIVFVLLWFLLCVLIVRIATQIWLRVEIAIYDIKTRDLDKKLMCFLRWHIFRSSDVDRHERCKRCNITRSDVCKHDWKVEYGPERNIRFAPTQLCGWQQPLPSLVEPGQEIEITDFEEPKYIHPKDAPHQFEVECRVWEVICKKCGYRYDYEPLFEFKFWDRREEAWKLRKEVWIPINY